MNDGEPVTVDSFGVQALTGTTTRPDAAGLERLIGALQDAAAGASEDERGELAAVLAWAHWALGRSSIAGRLADAALEWNPDHDPAITVAVKTRCGLLPEWAFHATPRR